MTKITLMLAGIIASAIFLCGNLYAQSSQKDGDWQFWSAASVEKTLNDYLKAVFEVEVRFGDDINRYIYQSEDAGIVYAAFDWLDLGANFRYVLADNGGQWEHEARPHLNATLKAKYLGADISNRSRFEYRYLTRTKDTGRYRNLTEIMLPLEWSVLEISPFVREEAFLKFDQDDYNENRLSSGASFKIAKNLKMEFYYLWQRLKSVGKWKDINVLGTQLKLLF
ncbi:MAG: DUF2490 domain-containing protein [Candidatus Omnitrophota bacterium]